MIGIAAGLEATGVLNVIAKYVLGRGSKVWIGQVSGGTAEHLTKASQGLQPASVYGGLFL
jgi:hypothetical protein